MSPWARQMLDMAQNYMNYKIVIYTAGGERWAQFMRCVLTSWGLDVAVTLSIKDCLKEKKLHLKVLARVQDALRDQRGLEVHIQDMLMLENKPRLVRPRERARGVPDWIPSQNHTGRGSD